MGVEGDLVQAVSLVAHLVAGEIGANHHDSTDDWLFISKYISLEVLLVLRSLHIAFITWH